MLLDALFLPVIVLISLNDSKILINNIKNIVLNNKKNISLPIHNLSNIASKNKIKKKKSF